MAKKKVRALKAPERRALIDCDRGSLSIVRQCDLLGLSRSTYYFKPLGETLENLTLMRLIDEEYTRRPFYGSRKMTAILCGQGYCVNRKRAQRLMVIMGLEAVYQRPRTTIASKDHKKYPYLLRGLAIEEPNFVWSSDITYIRMENGFVFLTYYL